MSTPAGGWSSLLVDDHCRPAGERASLVSGKPESETDSMAEYGEGDAGRFTEDGSFIGWLH